MSKPAAGSVWAAGYRATTLAIVVFTVLIAFETYAVSTTMPVAAGALGGIRDYGLAFSLFSTTTLVGVVIAGGWNDRHGPAVPLLAGLSVFAVGLVVAGLASSYAVLLLGRSISGFGAGAYMVSTYVVVAATFPSILQPQVFGVISASWVLPSLFGPLLAGLLATHISWRAPFLLVPPLMLMPLPVMFRRLRALGEPADAQATAGSVVRPAVLARALLLAAGALLLQWSAHAGGSWRSAVVAIAAVVALALALPGLVPPGTLQLRHGLPSLVVFRLMIAGVFFSAETFIPLMLVEHRGLTPATAGLVLTAGALGWFIGSWSQGRPSFALDHALLVRVGAVLMGTGVTVLSMTALRSVPLALAPVFWIVAGLGMGWAMSSSSVLLLRLSADGETGRAASALQIGDNLGVLIGTSLAGAWFAARHQAGGDDTAVFVSLWFTLGVVGITSVFVARRIAPRSPRQHAPARVQ